MLQSLWRCPVADVVGSLLRVGDFRPMISCRLWSFWVSEWFGSLNDVAASISSTEAEMFADFSQLQGVRRAGLVLHFTNLRS